MTRSLTFLIEVTSSMVRIRWFSCMTMAAWKSPSASFSCSMSPMMSLSTWSTAVATEKYLTVAMVDLSTDL